MRNAEAVTKFGQLVLQWTEKRINDYLNKVCGTENHSYVIYGDTDSLYIEISPVIDKVGLDRFKVTNDLVDFMDALASKKIEPVIMEGFKDMCEYLNNYEQLMFMDREALACPPLGTEGIGSFWRAKKNYALNVYDMEGTRYVEPHLKIMGMETQKSSTPKAVQQALYESIRIMLQDNESVLQKFYKDFEDDFKKLDYKVIAEVKTANNIGKYSDSKMFPITGCPGHIRAVLAYKRAIKKFDNLPDIMEGDKVMMLPLKAGNPFGHTKIAWPSGTEISQEIRQDVLKHLDYITLFHKQYKSPLESMCESNGLKYEKRASLEDMFDF